MTRLLSIAAAALLALVSWRLIADDDVPSTSLLQPDVRFLTDSADPAKAPSSDKPASQDETAVERAARFKKLLRSEVVGDMRWLWDTQFAYPEHVAKLEANYDKCLDEERYQDGEKLAAELLAMHKAAPQHILLSVWEFEATLCGLAVGKELGPANRRRHAVAKQRWKQIEYLATDEAKRLPSHPSAAGGGIAEGGADSFGAAGSPSGGLAGMLGGGGAVAAADPAIPLLYLFLRALNCAARHDDNIADEINRGVKAVLDNVSVSIPVSADTIGYGYPLTYDGKKNSHWPSQRMVLRDVPADLLLYRELVNIKPDNLYVISPIEAGSPFRKFQLGTSQAAQLASQKASESESQQRIATTLKELFPTEAIEVHVVRSTAILRAALRNPVHEEQIVSIATALAHGVLNQMTVNGDPNDLAPGVEKLALLGNDPNGLREVLAKLYPKEHIEVHVLPINNSVVLRGHLSRPEYAKQVFDIAKTSYGTVLYQMTPALPAIPLPAKSSSTKPPSKRAAPTKAAVPVGDDAEASERIGDATIIRMTHPDVEGAAEELRTKFGERAKIDFGPRLDSISVEADPQVIEEVRAAVKAMEPKKTFNPLSVLMGGGGTQEGSMNAPRVASIPTTDVQEAALDREARELAMKFRVAKLDQQAALRRQLEQLTERHFDQRQERRQREIDDLTHRVDVLRVTHQRRGQNRATVIQQRVQDLLDPNADLRWDELQTNEDSSTNASRRVGTAHQGNAGGNPFGGAEKRVGSAHPTTTTATPTAASSVEPTFNGTAYSEWLKMLDTERKPEKLAAAMDACSRLASPADVPRIVRSIIAAAEPFETAETSERMNVLSTGCRGLGRLLNSDTAHGTDFVFAEVQSRIDNGSFIGTHGVVCLFLSALGSGESLVNTDAPIPSLQVHAAPIIAALLRHHAALKQFDPRLADAATGVWMLSKAPIDDFAGLRPFVMKGFESRIVDKGRYWPWHSLKSREYAVQLPEVVTILTEQFDKKPDVLVRDLGALGPLAEPAVPKLVARLVDVWKSREEMDRATAAGRGSRDSDSDITWQSQMGFVFDALQKIGPQAKSAVPILKELLSICPANSDGDNVRRHRRGMKSAINDTLRAIGDTADVGGPQAPPLLSDFSHLTTIWKLTSSQPGQTIEGIRMSVGRVVEFSGKQQVKAEIIGLIGCGTNPRSYVIDESTTPKQITLVDKDIQDFQQSGIYELKGDRLKIEFAKPGLARPTGFAADPEKLPEGHVLLEFERDR